MIGINEEKILSAEIHRHIDADKIISVTHPWYFEGYIQEQVGYLPNWIIDDLRIQFLKNTHSQNNLKIFLDRSGSKFNHLKILNNEEVINSPGPSLPFFIIFSSGIFIIPVSEPAKIKPSDVIEYLSGLNPFLSTAAKIHLASVAHIAAGPSHGSIVLFKKLNNC